jgi:hypothetical protein
MAKKIMVSIEDSGGVSDIYGGNFLDERKRIKIEKTKSPSFAVDFILQKLYDSDRSSDSTSFLNIT